MREPDAKETFARVTTYGVLVLALLVAGLAACASDLIAVLMPPTFQPAARVVPWVGLGVALQGIYLLTSIGLNITKRTEYYPVATAIAAGTSIGANLLLIPTFGIIGAAWANVTAYAVLALVAARFSQRFYPITYEGGRLARIVGAGLLALFIARMGIPAMRPVPAFLAHGLTVVLVFFGVLVATRFFVAHEVAELSRLLQRVRRRRVIDPPADITELAGEIVTTPAADMAEEFEPSGDEDGRR